MINENKISLESILNKTSEEFREAFKELEKRLETWKKRKSNITKNSALKQF